MIAKKDIFCFLILAVLALKISALHLHSHHDEAPSTEECELCEIAIQIQHAEFSPLVSQNVVDNTTTQLISQVPNTFSPVGKSFFSACLPFTRPPPST